MNRNQWNEFDPEMFEGQMRELGNFLESTTKRVRKAWNETQQQMNHEKQIIDVKLSDIKKVHSNNSVLKRGFTGKKFRIKTAQIANQFSGAIFAVFGLSGLFIAIQEILANRIIGGHFGELVISVGVLLFSGFCFFRGRLYQRAQQYLEFLKGKTSSNVEYLAAFTGVSERQVKKDLRKLSQARLIQAVFLSPDGNEVFSNIEQYEEHQKELEQAKQKEKLQEKPKPAPQPKEEEQADSPSEHIFLVQMRELNNKIEDKDVSQKIDQICEICEKIFEQSKEMKDTPASFKKFESYYLPTTIKLLEVYTEVDDQPVDGVNIETIRRDIPSILNTLIQAYQNLLDSLYANMAMDVSSEIAVLKDMLTQEGLVENEFSIK